MSKIKSRIQLFDLAVKLVEITYGKLEDPEHLLEVLQTEFPEDNYTEEDLMEWNSLQAEIEDISIQLKTQGLCCESLQSTSSPISNPD
jgi:hypothetical protein